MKLNTVVACAAALALSISLTACGGSENFASPAQQETKAPVDGGSFGTIEDLRDAAEKAGIECPAWDVHNKHKFASSSADCSSNFTLAIYATEKSKETQLAVWKELGDMVELERLVGQNWTIDTDDPEALQKKMGGTVFRTAGK